MKGGAENRKKTIIAGALISAAVIGFIYVLITQILPTFSSAPAPAPPPPAASSSTSSSSSETVAATPSPAATRHSSASAKTTETASAGVPATRLASTSASLDPTLDETAMLRTESLVYSGTGRNIFSSTYTAPAPVIPKVTFTARKVVQGPPPPQPPPVIPVTCPPSCPPINLKFFGTATRPNGVRQAFLLEGEDVYLASQGDIVARKYKIASISANSIQVEDLSNHNTQTLPLTTN